MLASGNNDVLSSLRTLIPVRPTRYDLLLAIIPVAFLLAVFASTLLSAPPRTALVAASAVGALAVVDGLFRNPPTVGASR